MQSCTGCISVQAPVNVSNTKVQSSSGEILTAEGNKQDVTKESISAMKNRYTCITTL